MRRHAGVAAAVLLGMVALAGCAGDADPAEGLVRADVEARTVAIDDASALPAVAQASRGLGMLLLAAAGDDTNTVVSPSSLQLALSMLSEGARGGSLTELEAAVGASGETRRDAVAALRGALAPLDGDPKDATGDTLPAHPIVHLADQVVIDEGFEVSPEFLEKLADVYDAGIQYADLSGDAGKAVLDAWTQHHTGGLIPQSAIVPNDDLRVVFQDAVLFAARWQAPFDAAETYPQDFTLPGGERVAVDMMHDSAALVAYAEVEGWRAARLAYDDTVHADVLLPPAGTDPATAAPALLQALDAALDTAEPQSVDLALPVIDTTGRLDLLPALDALGVGSVACDSGTADLSGIAGGPGDLCLAQAVQQTVLTVDEAGTVAAALTEGGTESTSAPVGSQLALHLDRPFLFQIAHTDTDWLLFTAAIRDPRS